MGLNNININNTNVAIVDDQPIKNSDNLVKSGGVKTELDKFNVTFISNTIVNDNSQGSSGKTIGPFVTSINLPSGTVVKISLSELSKDGYCYLQVFAYNGSTRLEFISLDGDNLANGDYFIKLSDSCTEFRVISYCADGVTSSVKLNVSVGIIVDSEYNNKLNYENSVHLTLQTLTNAQKEQARQNIGCIVDSVPTKDSTNAVSSGGVRASLDIFEKQQLNISVVNNNREGSSSKHLNNYYNCSLPSGTVVKIIVSNLLKDVGGSCYLQIFAYNGDTRLEFISLVYSQLLEGDYFIKLSDSCTRFRVSTHTAAGELMSCDVSIDTGEVVDLQYIALNPEQSNEYVKYTSQSLTDTQKKQARQNIGLGNGDIDSTPTRNSTNLVTSGGVKTELDKFNVNFLNYNYSNDNPDGESSRLVGPFIYNINIPSGTIICIEVSDLVKDQDDNGSYVQLFFYNGDTRLEFFSMIGSTLTNGKKYITLSQNCTSVRINGTTVAHRSVDCKLGLSYGQFVNLEYENLNFSNELDKRLQLFPLRINYANVATYLPDANNALKNTRYFITSSNRVPNNYPQLFPLNGVGHYLETIYSKIEGTGEYLNQAILSTENDDVLWRRTAYLSNGSWVWGDWKSIHHKITVYSPNTPADYFIGQWGYNNLYEALKFAAPNENTEILVQNGTHDLIQEIGEDLTSSFLGVPLGHNVKVRFCSKSYVTMHYTGDDDGIMENTSAFFSHYGDYEVDGLKIRCSKVRYCVHDDLGSQAGEARHIYRNCDMYIDNSNSSWHATQCIGGGLGTSTTIIVENCKFESESATANDPEISWHNSSNDHASSMGVAKSEIHINNIYCVNGGVQFGCYGSSTEKTKCYCSNSSIKSLTKIYNRPDLYQVDNMEILSWNNEIRV